MKNLLTSFLILLPLWAAGQSDGVLVIKEIRNGSVCDSCLVTMAGNVIPSRVSFLTPNHENQFLYIDSTLTTNFTTVEKSQFFIAMAEFSLDFYPYKEQSRKKPFAIAKPSVDIEELQFRTQINGVAQSDWKEIRSLPLDPDFYLGHAHIDELSDHSDQPQTTPAKHYHAGKFRLALGDSLTVYIRRKDQESEAYHFSIKRVQSVPDYFEFIQFPATKGFEEVLNTEVNKRRIGQGPQSNYLEMEAGHSAFLRFANDEQYYFFGHTPRNSGIEYALGDRPDNWKSLGGKNLKFTNGFTYIYLNNPASGKILKVFLRYKHQRESVYIMTIRVKDVPGVAGWIYMASILLVLCTAFVLGYFVQKVRYRKRLNLLNRKKLEVENQLQLLTGQLNPHFLFNSLNAVQGLIRQNDNEAANQYITEVATFLRTIMDSGKKDFVSLQEEIRIEESYIALEQKRSDFLYTVDNQCNQNLADIDFPPLLLQPIIENSIRHGFAAAIANPMLTIGITCNELDLIVTISDNGMGFDPKVNARGHGLSLTKKRIALISERLSPMQITLQTESRPGSGSKTEIRLFRWLS
jgi:hypothetical protein